MPDHGGHVAALFEAAVSLDPGQRSAFLDRACGDNGSLRQEVEELLQADAGAGIFLNQPVFDLPTADDGHGSQATIGPYTLYPSGICVRSATHRPAVFSAVGAIVLLLVLVAMLRHSPAAAPIRSLAVLPLENLSGDTNREYFADGMTDELITELARIPGLRVVSRSSVMRENGTRKPLDQIARELNVDAVVEGSVIRVADKVRITAQLTDTRNDKDVWAQSFEGRAGDILSLQDDVAREIAAQAEVALAPAARASMSDGKPIDPAAHDAYLRGRYFLDKREPKKSADYFQQAIAIDPTYAAAFAGLGDALFSETVLDYAPLVEAFPKALAAAKHAIELDPTNEEAYSFGEFSRP